MVKASTPMGEERNQMGLFEVQQDYHESGTNYFEVEASTLEEAIKLVEVGEVTAYKERIWSWEDHNYDDSFEYTESDEWVQ
jgi:hypothetical protein